MQHIYKKSLGRHAFLYPLPALLIGSYDINGLPNVMTASWGGMAASDPLALAVSIRPARWTYQGILQHKSFTVGVPSEALAVETDYVGMVSGRRFDKTSIAGLNMVKAEHVDAPYVEQCPIVLECTLSQTLELGSHTMMIGLIEDVKADPSCLGDDGIPDIERINPIVFDGGTRAYYGMGHFIGKAFSIGKMLMQDDEADSMETEPVEHEALGD